ncbi:MAG: hypothetical protein CSA62_06695 [Planctomycetota bacterium]|nr:MAG: hypothetical protein CSA62_06695 [Planctomycetota bacterium]
MNFETRCLAILFTTALSAGASNAQEQAPPAAVAPANTLSAAEQKAGWQLLFDGKSSEHWRGFKKKAFPQKGWKIENGTLHVIAGGGGGDIITKQKHRDFEFVLDWKVDVPNANSGIIYRVSEALDWTWQTGPEMQILGDPKPSTVSTCAGGLYALYDSAKTKKLSPIGQWNRARIIVVGNHIEHWLNGVKLLECEMHSPDWYKRVAKSKFGKMPFFGTVGCGHIALQEHGSNVWFRNIKLRPLSRQKMSGGKSIALFDGKTLKNWSFVARGNGDPAAVWSVEKGVLKCTGETFGYIRTLKDYQDFILELDWRWPGKPSNSGVLLRMTGPDKVWPQSIEAQLMHGRAGDFWAIGKVTMKTEPARRKGSNTRHLQKAELAPGKWNHYRIFVSGGKVELEINGRLVNEAWGCFPDPGKICLQSEGGPIEFRNLKLTPLASRGPKGLRRSERP